MGQGPPRSGAAYLATGDPDWELPRSRHVEIAVSDWLSVDIAAVSYSDHRYEHRIIFNQIENPISANTDSIFIRTAL